MIWAIIQNVENARISPKTQPTCVFLGWSSMKKWITFVVPSNSHVWHTKKMKESFQTTSIFFHSNPNHVDASNPEEISSVKLAKSTGHRECLLQTKSKQCAFFWRRWLSVDEFKFCEKIMLPCGTGKIMVAMEGEDLRLGLFFMLLFKNSKGFSRERGFLLFAQTQWISLMVYSYSQ